MPLRLEIGAPGASPKEVTLRPGRTEVVAAPREQYRLIGEAGEIPADVRVLRVEHSLRVVGLPDGQELELSNFFRACRPGADCTLGFAGPDAPEATISNDSPSLAALTDGSFLLYGAAEPGTAPPAYGGAGDAGAISPWGIGLAALLGVGVAAGAGGGGGGDGSGAPTPVVLGAGATQQTAGTPPPPAPPPTDTTPPVPTITDSVPAPVTRGPVTFTFAFGERVVGFDTGDVTVTGGTKGDLVTGDGGRTWTMTVTPETGVADGRIAVSVAAGAATDEAGNPTGAADASQRIDTRAPVVTITDDTAAATTNRPVTFTIAFSEPVLGFVDRDVAVEGGSRGQLVTLAEGLRYTVTATPPPDQAAGTITLAVPADRVTDAAGNPNAAATATQAVDTRAPQQQAFAFSVYDDQPPRVVTLGPGETTNDRSPTLTLTLDSVLGPGETLALSRDGAVVATRTGTPLLAYTDSGLAPGRHVYAASVSDAAGNVAVLDLNGPAPDGGFTILVT